MKEEGKRWLSRQRDQSEENKLNRDELTPNRENYANRDVTVEED
jgi:hypothetical protein